MNGLSDYRWRTEILAGYKNAALPYYFNGSNINLAESLKLT